MPIFDQMGSDTCLADEHMFMIFVESFSRYRWTKEDDHTQSSLKDVASGAR